MTVQEIRDVHNKPRLSWLQSGYYELDTCHKSVKASSDSNQQYQATVVQDFRDESPLIDKKLKVYDLFFMVKDSFFVSHVDAIMYVKEELLGVMLYSH